MRIKLETLPHQTRALEAINKKFPGIDKYSDDPDANYIYANPLIKGRYQEKNNIDIKMETGTGKTYVYTRMMYELHKQHGLFKFIIVVPSPSIKEGTRSFITSDYAKQHFSEFYENTSVQLNVINKGDFNSRSGRKNFPAQLSEFVEATRQNVNQIQVLLINAGMLNSKNMKSSDYDQTLLGGETCPLKAIAATRPVVIIDEPHRFPRDKKFYKMIEELKPQWIVRFGATFPEITEGRGKNKVVKRDYYRGEPQFDLNAIDSFNQGLVKGIDIDYPDLSKEEASNLYKVKSAKPRELTLTKDGKEYTIKNGENLADIDPEFAGSITYEGSSDHLLSNGLALEKDMKLIPGIYSTSYQDQIITEAIDKHFKAEKANFLRPNNAPKIKTLSLFFIDSIYSFRGSKDGNGKGWLAEHFEKILTKKLKDEIEEAEFAISDREKEYASFLKATLKSLNSDNQDVYAGYFSEDNANSDEEIQKQVDDILKNKEKLLSFKDKNGNWITRRFLFSKWTLREGWDNPNVFVIAKLRSSGSENSKIQEVGRGLRLPVDENGHRLPQEEWQSRLSFLISFDEEEFASKLVGEINSDVRIKIDKTKLTDDMVDLAVKEIQKDNPDYSKKDLLNKLGKLGVIDFDHNFEDRVTVDNEEMSGYDAFMKLYPAVEHKTHIVEGTVRDMKAAKIDPTRIKLRKSNWDMLKDLWQQLARRQMIVYSDGMNEQAASIAKEVFRNDDNFVIHSREIIHQEIRSGQDKTKVEIRDTRQDYNSGYYTLAYGKFLKQLAVSTNLSVNLINNLMIDAMARFNNQKKYINEKTLANLIRDFNKRFNEVLKENYHYQKLDFYSNTSIYNSQKQEFVDTVPATALGIYSDNAVEDDKYLYDRPPLRFDSTDPELKILKRTYDDKIIAFGKLPKSAIKIPRYDKGTTTPDFIFVIEREDGQNSYLVVETKAENMRKDDEVITSIQKNYFDQLKNSNVYYKMATSEDDFRNKLQEVEDSEEIN
ncbi:type III restriction-modification system endonuclease [Lactobacillus psittaci]|uniref:Type III site-specific deoxyribonuclease n=1 Tax=Lactobacillus psittaci DSM 15354 TaxID=1122152 RepID=A0A0R1S3F7_9LACO|nr:type III restriction-modification system endonuclease [Lactobacillus psittaci]KRL63070.1 type III site-specific deoxyribonuclease [Lactobacillus psittaci DSM 15354]